MLRGLLAALSVSVGISWAFAATAQAPAAATPAEVKKIVDEGVAQTAAASAIDKAAAKKAADDAAAANTAQIKAMVDTGIRDAAKIGADRALDTLKARLAAEPIDPTCHDLPSYDPRWSAQNIEQRAALALKCCPEDPADGAATADYTHSSMVCVHNAVQVLAYAHDRQARNRQRWFFGETDTSAVGAAALVIGGTKAAESTTVAWSIIALAPVIIEEITAQGPRSQVHYAAAHAFARLDEHYRVLDRRLRALSKLKVDNGAVIGACAQLKEIKDLAKGDLLQIAVLNTEIATFKTYCADFHAAAGSYRPYGLAMAAAYRDLPDRFAEDAQAIEGVFHKISFGLQAPPSKALAITLAAPLEALASAIRSGKTITDYKAREATYELEKDGLPLSPSWPALPGPDKILPTTSLALSKSGQAAIDGLKSGADKEIGSKAQAVEIALNNVVAASANAEFLQTGSSANDIVSAIRDGAGTYKMIFDFRATKRTADIEFTRIADKK